MPLVTGTSRLEHEDGAWEGDHSGAYWTPPDVAAVIMVSPEDGVELDPARIRSHTVENEHPTSDFPT